MTTEATPTRAQEFLNLAIEHGCAVSWVPNVDTGGSPFVTIQVAREDLRLEACWHTRDTGTYRLFSLIHGRNRAARDVTLTRAIGLITTGKAATA
jgi:hypothetical protein